MRARGRTWVRGAAVAGIAAITILVAPARAYASDESQLLALTNQVRASKGLAALSIDSQLSSVAQRWAVTLAERGVISHNSSLPGQVTGWKVLGENVGVGGTVQAVHEGWMASPTHYQNLVDPAFTRVGFGIVRPDARVFVVQVFMLPKSATVAPPAAPAPSAPSTTVVSPRTTTVPTSASASAQEALPAEALPSLGRVRSLQPW